MSEALKIENHCLPNEPMIARIRAHMNRKGLNPKTLAERAKVGRSFVYDIMNGKSTNPTSSKLAAIAEQLDVSVQYLLNGAHEVMCDNRQEWNEVVEISSITVRSTETGSVLVSSDEMDKPYYFRSEWICKKLHARPEHLRSIFIKGDSMNPTLTDGDAILVNITMRAPSPAGIYVTFDGVGLSVKRLEMVNKDRVRVLSDNMQYSGYELDLSEINIIGKVVWLAREM